MIKLLRVGLKVKYYTSDPLELKKLEAGLKFYVDGAEWSPSYRSGKWDGYYRFYDTYARTFNYGLLHIALQHLQKLNIKYKLENDFVPLKIQPGLIIDPDMWQHQKEGIIRFLRQPYGTCQIPTRGGKTKMAAEIVRLLGFKHILFQVDSQQLFDQATKDFSAHLGISRRQIGQIKGDTFIIKPITIAMVQTLQSINGGLTRLRTKAATAAKKGKAIPIVELREQRAEKRTNQKELWNYLATVELLVIDEIHECGSDDRVAIASRCSNARGVLCLSATPEKSSSLLDNIKIKSIGGPIIYKVPAALLKERGVLSEEQIVFIMVNHEKDRNIHIKEKDTYDTYEEKLIVQNERRNNILLNTIQILRHLQVKTLVLFEYRKHAKYVQQILGDELLTGETELQQRIQATKQFLKRKAGILLATNIFKKGITLPEVEVLVNASAGKEQSAIIQKKGRVLGKTTTKSKAITIDLIDIGDYFSEHSLSRVEAYEREVGLEYITIFDSLDENFYMELREFLTNWKNEE